MNYYERHLGDYARDTAHLSLIEHGVYTLLMDRYYATEAPIPADQTYRLARAKSRDERAAVDTVLREFFELLDDAYVNHRCEEEIAKAQARISAAQSNGKRGGRPKKNPAGSEAETHEKPTGLLLGSKMETQQKAHHTPDTSNQSEEQDQKLLASPRGSRLPTDWQPPDDWLTWATAERPEVDARNEAAKFADFWRSKAGKDARKTDWLATWRNWIRNARGSPSRPAQQPGAKPSAAADFRGKTYAATAIDDLPPDLRDAARAAIAGG